MKREETLRDCFLDLVIALTFLISIPIGLLAIFVSIPRWKGINWDKS